METKDVIALLFERAAAMQVFWNFFIVIATAILGFLAAIKVSAKPSALSLALTIAFSIFAFSNYGAIENVRKQRVAVAEYAASLNTDANTKLKEVIDSGRPVGALLLRLFHLVADSIVIALIWIIPIARSRDVNTKALAS